jgi:hypothetical protein
VRDLLRRRRLLVQQRTCHLLSFNSLVSRQTGSGIDTNTIGKLTEEDIKKLLEEENALLAGQTNVEMSRYLTQQIRKMESAALKKVRLLLEYKKLLSTSGIGKILALTIMLGQATSAVFPVLGITAHTADA